MTNRTFRPIINAVVTPASVQTKTAANGTKYALLSKASVQIGDADPIERTVMAFGKSRDAVAGLLRKGRAVELAVQHDGGTLRVIGLPRAAAA